MYLSSWVRIAPAVKLSVASLDPILLPGDTSLNLQHYSMFA